MQLLKEYGLIMLPIDNPYLSGAIYVKKNKKIPFINTAQTRANQYFTAWHEVYHLMFDDVSFNHMISSEVIVEERKAENFASQMLLGNLLSYYIGLPLEMNFLFKICCCMDVFQTPYKAILISLYELAQQSQNAILMENIKKYFDVEPRNISEIFIELGLDNTLVLPSYVVNMGTLEAKMNEQLINENEMQYHRDNMKHLENIKKEISMIIGNADD
jgi:hypothetical protein